MSTQTEPERKKPSNPPVKDLDTLAYPMQIVEAIGLSANEINRLKARGCLFHGNKTTIRWVREFIRKEAQTAAEKRLKGCPEDESGSEPA